MKNESLFPDDEAPRVGRPKTSPLDRKEQLRLAQANRRAKLHADGLTRAEIFLDAPARAKAAAMMGAGVHDLSAAVILALARYDDRSTADLTGLAPALVDDLETLFPELDLPEALAAAASKWVGEVKRKRKAAKVSRKKAPKKAR